MYGRILAAIDGSETSTRAYREAVRLAADQHAALRIAHVVDLGAVFAPWADTPVVNFESLETALRDAAAHLVDAAVTQARSAGVMAEAVLLEAVVNDVPAEILAEAARWSADLIVMGTHGRHGLAHLIMGSVAEGVIQLASVPVLLLRAWGHPSSAA